MPFLSRSLATNPDGFAVADGRIQWTYRELHQEALEVAGRLETLGVGAGDVVALAGSMDGQILAALHGAWMAGCVVAPLNPGWTPKEVENALSRLKPRILLQGTLPEGPDASTRHPGEVEAYSLGSLVLLDAASGSSHTPLADVKASAGFHPMHQAGKSDALLLTSGTAGEPEIVSLTVGNLTASASAAAQRLGLRPTDRWLFSLSLSHVGGLAMASRAAYLGSALILRSTFQVDEFLFLAANSSVTHVSLVPTMLHQTLEEWGGRRAPTSLECVLMGGDRMPGGLTDRALAADFPLALTYGLTEASSQVATAPPPLVRRKPGTVGAPLKGVEMTLNSEGEILLRGPTVAAGRVSEDGWLHTGDLGKEDDEGHLWITGRLSDRIISGGVNVDPAEVEALLQSHPGVQEATVVGVPDEKWGERVAAVVVRDSSGTPEIGDLEGLAQEVLSPAKRPRVIRFVDKLPRNPNGKVDRNGVRNLFK